MYLVFLDNKCWYVFVVWEIESEYIFKLYEDEVLVILKILFYGWWKLLRVLIFYELWD